MPSSIIPNQDIILDPYQSPIFDYDTYSSKIYISEQINKLLTPFGNNIVINGFELVNYDMDDDYNIQCELNTGMCIIDNTLIEYKEKSTININCLNYDTDGLFIIVLSYDSVKTSYMNKSKLGIYYLNSINKSDNIFDNQNNIILNVIQFNKDDKYITNSTQREILINNILYDVYPIDNHKKELIKIININSIFNNVI